MSSMMTLVCDKCSATYRIGEDAIITSSEEIAGQHHIVGGSPASATPDLVALADLERMKNVNLEAFQEIQTENEGNVRRVLASRSRQWQCHNCKTIQHYNITHLNANRPQMSPQTMSESEATSLRLEAPSLAPGTVLTCEKCGSTDIKKPTSGRPLAVYAVSAIFLSFTGLGGAAAICGLLAVVFGFRWMFEATKCNSCGAEIRASGGNPLSGNSRIGPRSNSNSEEGTDLDAAFDKFSKGITDAWTKLRRK